MKCMQVNINEGVFKITYIELLIFREYSSYLGVLGVVRVVHLF